MVLQGSAVVYVVFGDNTTPVIVTDYPGSRITSRGRDQCLWKSAEQVDMRFIA
jgi:hypothetical protein